MTVLRGDCVEVMAGMSADSVDAIVCDPPYDLVIGRTLKLGPMKPQHAGSAERRINGGFMGKEWDGTGVAFRPETWAAALRVAKPGAYLLAFGGTRTVHRMTCALEDAGWVVRDMLVWAYASGFPKSRASLKPAWEPIVLCRKPGRSVDLNIDAARIGTASVEYVQPEAQRDHANGTHLDFASKKGKRPFHYGDERKTVGGPTTIMSAWDDDANLCASCAADAGSRARLGTSGTRASTTPRRAAPQPNDSATPGDTSRAATGCSDGMTAEPTATSSSTGASGSSITAPFPTGTSSTTSTGTSSTTGSRTCSSCGATNTATTTTGTTTSTPSAPPRPTTSAATAGRWPPNLILTDPILDGGWEGVVGGGEQSGGGNPRWRSEEASAKTYGGFETGDPAGYLTGKEPTDTEGTYSRFFLIPKAPTRERVLSDGRRSPHPTQKPEALIRHLVTLVTPPGGLVLDPFLGSGTLGVVADGLGVRWVGIEREAEYADWAEDRIADGRPLWEVPA
jgi:DNA modification methylase